MKKHKKIIIAAILSFILLSPNFTSADGGIYILKDQGLDTLEQEHQNAYINHQNGREKLIIEIKLKEIQSDAFWIVPIPSSPENIKTDIISETPHLAGIDVIEKAKHELNSIRETLYATQLYPIPFMLLTGIGSTNLAGSRSSLSEPGKSTKGEGDITVFEHIEKEGMVMETITAKTGDALESYLKSKGVEAKSSNTKILDEYIGKDFSFIVSWINSEKTPTKEDASKGIFVDFPQEKIYYPMKLTSIYQEKEIPITLRIIGFVPNEIPKSYKENTTAKYYAVSNFEANESIIQGKQGENPFFEGFEMPANLEYTSFEIKSEAKNFTEDIYISKNVYTKALYSHFIYEYSTWLMIIFLLVASMLASLLSALTVFKETRHGAGTLKFFLLGLFNLLSILVFLIAAFLVKTNVLPKEKEKKYRELGQFYAWGAMIFDLRKLAFLPLFSLYFMILSWGMIKIVEILI